MRNMITRTFDFTVYDCMCVNTVTKEIVNIDVRLPKRKRSDARVEADIKAALFELDPDLKFTDIDAIHEAHEFRAMSEATFIANSQVVDKNSNKEEE